MAEYFQALIKQQERVKWVIKGIDFDECTDWEKEFLESIENQSLKNKLLSQRQEEIMERIYKEKGK